MTKTMALDISEYLDSEEMMAEYLNAILEENDSDLLLEALGDIAKAKGMTSIAESSGLGRESLYKSLRSDANPKFSTIQKVVTALGLQLNIGTA